MKLYFDVKNQIITRTDRNQVIANSSDYLEAEVTFSEEWTGLEKTMTFKNGDVLYTIVLNNDKILQENHLNLGVGTWKVSIQGVAGDQKIVTNESNLAVNASGWVGSEAIPPESVWNQLLVIIESLHTEVASTAALRSAVQKYIEDNYDALVKEEVIVDDVRAALDDMAEDGTLSDLLAPLVAAGMPSVVADQISAVVAAQIDSTVASQIGAVVASQITAPVNQAVKNYCDDNFSGWSGALDRGLTQPLMAAPADLVGGLKSALSELEDDIYVNPSFSWEIGGIGSQSSDITNSINIRTVTGTYYYLPNGTEIGVDDDSIQFAVARYRKVDFAPGVRTNWGSTDHTIDDADTYCYRITMRKADQSTLSDTSIASHLIVKTHEMKIKQTQLDIVKYVDVSGDDTNSGDDASHPYATFQKAINENAKTIIAKSGTYKGQIISVDKFTDLTIKSYDGEPVVLDNSDTIAFSSDVGTGLLKATKTFANTTNWYAVFIGQTKDPVRTGTQSLTYNVILWEVGTTAKKLVPVLALATCQATEGSFYYDGTSVYVNPSQNGATYRYLLNEDVSIFRALHLNKLSLSNIHFAYSDDHTVVLGFISNSDFTDCKAYRSAYGGGFRTLSANVVFNSCESYEHCSDGFGLSNYSSYNNGETIFNNCKAHDNGDDGISHHTGCKGAIYGGEFARNGKGGITPAYGAVVDIYNAICHHNRFGIYFTANSAEKTDKVQNMVACAMYDNTENDLKLEYSQVREYLCYHGTPSTDANSNLQTIGA